MRIIFKNLLKSRVSKYATLYLFTLIALTSCTLLLYSHGYRLNLTQSLPIGVWRIVPHDILHVGDYVFVPPENNPGYNFAIERNYIHENNIMLKKIVAVENDLVNYDSIEKSVTVNGVYIPMTEIHAQDSKGRPMHSANYPFVLKENQVWLSSEFIRGFDSRYFGPVKTDFLLKAIPIWTFK